MAATLPAAVCERLQLLPTYFEVTPYNTSLLSTYGHHTDRGHMGLGQYNSLGEYCGPHTAVFLISTPTASHNTVLSSVVKQFRGNQSQELVVSGMKRGRHGYNFLNAQSWSQTLLS